MGGFSRALLRAVLRSLFSHICRYMGKLCFKFPEVGQIAFVRSVASTRARSIDAPGQGPIDRLADRLTDRLTDRPIDRSTARSTDRPDRPIDRPTDRSIGRTTDQLIDRLTDREARTPTSDKSLHRWGERWIRMAWFVDTHFAS